MPLADRKQDSPVLPKCTPREKAQAIAAELFDEALTNARIETAEVAYVLDVSESLVRRWRSKDARERASYVQMLMLGPKFGIELHRATSRRFKFGRAALAQAIEALGALALSEEL
jgi:hypothetical protein